MKIQSIILGCLLTSSVFADAISFERDGSAATLIGTMNSTSSEVYEFVSDAYDYGFKDANGADFFNKSVVKQGMRSYVAFTNKNVKSSFDSGFAVVFELELKGKVGDITVDSNRKFATVKGEAARMLMGALATKTNIDNRGPVGVGRVATKSGKVVCTKVVAPRAVPSCTLKL